MVPPAMRSISLKRTDGSGPSERVPDEKAPQMDPRRPRQQGPMCLPVTAATGLARGLAAAAAVCREAAEQEEAATRGIPAQGMRLSLSLLSRPPLATSRSHSASYRAMHCRDFSNLTHDHLGQISANLATACRAGTPGPSAAASTVPGSRAFTVRMAGSRVVGPPEQLRFA